jgi:protein-tyrosine phosphatase
LDQFAASGGDPALLMPVLGVQESYLRAALDQVATEHGTLEGYLTVGLGLSPATLEALRERLIEG